MREIVRKLVEELVTIYETDNGEKVVYGSELHAVLEVKSRYREWIERRIFDCDAIKNIDYQEAEISAPSGQTKKDHIIKLDTAKEMAMLERNDKGKQVRKYFIEVEKRYKQEQIDRSQLDPDLQRAYALIDGQAKLQLEQKKQAEQIEKIETKLDTMKEIFTTPIADWKEEINKRVRAIAQASNSDYKDVWAKLYSELETTAKCSLTRLCTNKKNRMEKAGNTKQTIANETTKLSVIFDNQRLKAIFEDIVKRYQMQYA